MKIHRSKSCQPRNVIVIHINKKKIVYWDDRIKIEMKAYQ